MSNSYSLDDTVPESTCFIRAIIMGRQNWKEKKPLKKGPGKKSKRQGDPELPQKLKEEDRKLKKVKSSEALGGRIQQRARKRKLKMALETAVSEEFSKKKKVLKSHKGQETKGVKKGKSKSVKTKPQKTVLKEGSNGSSGSKCLDNELFTNKLCRTKLNQDVYVEYLA